jgi:hypothetical protein
MNAPYPFGKKRYLLSFFTIVVASTAAYYVMTVNDPRTNLDPSLVLMSGIVGVILMLPLLASIVAIFVALFPYLSLSFSQKYFRSFLISLLALNAIYLVMCTYAAIRNTIN